MIYSPTLLYYHAIYVQSSTTCMFRGYEVDVEIPEEISITDVTSASKSTLSNYSHVCVSYVALDVFNTNSRR